MNELEKSLKGDYGSGFQAKKFRLAVLAGATLLISIGAGTAQARTITASLFSPLTPTGSSTVLVDGLTGTGYSVAFSPSFAADQGLVRGGSPMHAIPVAGASGAMPKFLTGGFGSALTTDAAGAGQYFSTGTGTITINFTSPQTSLALLWGSIDTENSLRFNDAAGLTVRGTDAQSAASGFTASGFQGPGGSAYVIITTDTPFTSVAATSSIVSFEFSGLVASTTPIVNQPEPASFVLLGIGIAAIAVGRRQRSRRAEIQ
jgi:hypothetical protein